MSLIASTGISQAPGNGFEAGQIATQDALTKMGCEPNLLIVFATSYYDQKELLRGIRSKSKDALIVGCSSAGEITDIALSSERTVSVMALCAEGLTLFPALSTPIKNGSADAGKNLAQSIKKQAEDAGEKLSFAMIFPDTFSAGNGTEIIQGMASVFGPDFPIVGGAPGDDQKYIETFQYLNDDVYSGHVVGIGFSDAVDFGVGVRHGWLPIGSPMTATKVHDNVLLEINHKPAIEIYREYFGTNNADLLTGDNKAGNARAILTYPLGIIQPDGSIIIRTPYNINEDGSIRFSADISEGSTIHIMIGSKDEALAAAKDAAKQCLVGLGGKKPSALIIFNCIGRKKLFGETADAEIRAIQEVVGVDMPILGFYTYGEQAPVDGVVKHMNRCNNTFHNQTIVICGLH